MLIEKPDRIQQDVVTFLCRLTTLRNMQKNDQWFSTDS